MGETKDGSPELRGFFPLRPDSFDLLRVVTENLEKRNKIEDCVSADRVAVLWTAPTCDFLVD